MFLGEAVPCPENSATCSEDTAYRWEVAAQLSSLQGGQLQCDHIPIKGGMIKKDGNSIKMNFFSDSHWQHEITYGLRPMLAIDGIGYISNCRMEENFRFKFVF